VSPRALLLWVLAWGVVACAPGESDPTARELSGVVVAVDARALGRVRGFTLRREGRAHEILIDSDTRFDFPPTHLRAHLVSGEPVRVEVVRRRGTLVARSIADA
jgi:hypothetical protein